MFKIQTREKTDFRKTEDGQEENLKERENPDIISKIYFMCSCECRCTVHEIQNKSKVVRIIAFSLQS